MLTLDLSAGKRAIWHDRLCHSVIWVDLRPEMVPTIVCDTRELPFPDNMFNLVVFDPPHMTHGESSDMAKQYGSFTAEEIRDLVRRTSNEAYRVTKPEALMSFKWNDHDVRLDHILPIMTGWLPLFGHNFKAGKKSETSWILLKKRYNPYQSEAQSCQILNMANVPNVNSTSS